MLYISDGPYPVITMAESEKNFKDPKTGEYSMFPTIHDKPSKSLSVIVPAYNEEQRLPKMLDEAICYLDQRQQQQKAFTYEIIVVDDGSSDNTSQVALDFSAKYGTDKIRVLTLAKNRGKGGAVRLGMLSARGHQLLFADADGASKFCDIEKLEEEVKRLGKKSMFSTPCMVVCGSRAHLEKESTAKRSLFRTILMHGWHLLVWLLCVRNVKDTQCGFKLLTRDAARLCFLNLHVERWAFDVDLLYIAEYLNMEIGEVAVCWTEIEGTKMIPLFSWLQMGKDLVLIWLRYFTGAWKISKRPEIDFKK